MKTELYVVRDNLAEESGPIYHAKNLAIAQRMFFELIKDSINPEDYSLYYIGSFDHDTMELLLDGSKKPIVIFEFDKKLEEFKGKVNNHA